MASGGNYTTLERLAKGSNDKPTADVPQGTPGGDSGAKVPRKLSYTSVTAAFAGTGVLSFGIVTFLLCTAGMGDEQFTAEYHTQTDPNAYQWPMIAFITAFALNFTTLLFERESSKMQLSLLTCYINFLAAFTDYLCWKGHSPIIRNCWGNAVQIQRPVMWLHTTPVMVYLLAVISDLSRTQVYYGIAADVTMILSYVIGEVVPWKSASLLLYALSFVAFFFTIKSLWSMFDGAISEAVRSSDRFSMKVLRGCTVVLWCAFPTIWLGVLAFKVSPYTEEWIWCVCDFCGKVTFSSSLLYSNFVTMEQRRLLAMRIISEGNRVRVIQELSDLIDQKERFMSGMSHELRTPLNGIIGLSDALLIGSCGVLNEAQVKTLTTIKTSGSRLLNLINDVLDAASMRKGRLVVKHERVNLPRLVDDVVELCQPLTRRGVRLLNDVLKDLPPVIGDQGRIIQILHNLIGNACKFTEQGYISISAQVKQDMVEIAVSDTGIGIPEDKYEQIFKPFEQVDMSTTRRYGGTGLGLNLVKELVAAHEGTIRVFSRVGHGTTFFFTLRVLRSSHDLSQPEYGSRTSQSQTPPSSAHRSPKPSFQVERGGRAGPHSRSTSNTGMLARSSSEVARVGGEVSAGALSTLPDGGPRISTESSRSRVKGVRPPPAKAPKDVLTRGVSQRLDKVRVLSVDDDQANHLVIQTLLAPLGYDVITAMDGKEALEILAAATNLPDVILLDVMMPGMSGFEVCRRLRESRAELAAIPVIMVSAKSKEEDIVEGLAAGANDYVVKPFNRKEIMARIEAHLRFREAVYQVGELAGTTLSDSSKAGSGCSGDSLHNVLVRSLLESRHLSLPNIIRTAVEQSRAPSHVQIFNQLTMAVIQVIDPVGMVYNNGVPATVGALSSLYIRLETLAEQHQLYIMESMDDCIVVLAGMQSEVDQVQRMTSFCASVLEFVSSLRSAANRPQLSVQIGLHAGPAQGVLVGVLHPVMAVLGSLPCDTHALKACCPPNCVHVSERIKQLMGSAGQEQLVGDASMVFGPTHLLKLGDWESALEAFPVSVESYMSGCPALLCLGARQLRPLQHAMITLIAAQPSFIIDLLNVSRENEKMRHHLALTESQLEEVSCEANRLQEELDQLRSQGGSPAQGLGLGQAAGEAAAPQPPAMSGAGFQVITPPHVMGGGNQGLLKALEARHLLAHATTVDKGVQAVAQPEGLEGHLEEAKHNIQLALTARNTLKSQCTDLARELGNVRGELDQKRRELQLLQRQARVEAAKLAAAVSAAMVSHQEAQALASPGGRSAARSRGSLELLPAPRLSSSVRSGEEGVKRSESQGTGLDEGVGIDAEAAERMKDAVRMHMHRHKKGDASGPDSGGGGGPPSSGSQQASPQGLMAMRAILEELGLTSLVPRFEEEQITPELLPFLDDVALRELGVVSLGARIKMRLAVQAIAPGPDE